MNSPLAAGASAAPVTWTEPAREAAFGVWLQAQSSAHALRPDFFAYAELQGGSHDIVDEQPAEWAKVVVDYLRA